jgi:hypothetical protein
MRTPYQGAKKIHITQGYSEQHKAIDLAFSECYGKPLVGVFNKSIVFELNEATSPLQKNPGSRGFGIHLKDLESDLHCVYFHTLGIFPKKRLENVLMGEITGFLGNSGYILDNKGVYVPLEKRPYFPYPGSHLHFEVFKVEEDGSRIYLNPMDYIDWSIGAETNRWKIEKLLPSISKTIQSIVDFLK